MLKDELSIIIILLFRTLIICIWYNQPKICHNATWDQRGITAADQSIINALTRGIFVDSNDTLYVADHTKGQILAWHKGSTTPLLILTAKLYEYTSLFVAMNGDIYYENGNERGRIDKWSRSSSTSASMKVFADQCFGLLVDIQNGLYCSMRNRHEVVKVLLDSDVKTVIRVAGTGSRGSAASELSGPWGIFIDLNFHLYVADTWNGRIQRFQSGQFNAETVAGNGIPNGLQLNHPTDVTLDVDGLLYIADNENHRIIRAGHDQYKCIAGCTGKKGPASNQLSKPYALRFDSEGNLHVADEYNCRIQRFSLSQDSCEISTTASTTVQHQTTDSCTTAQQTSLATTEKSPLVTTATAIPRSTMHFAPSPCPADTASIGVDCKSPSTPCRQLDPCRKESGHCTDVSNHQDYHCSCMSDFDGRHCEIDRRRCKGDTCLNDGSCSEKTSKRVCGGGWEGERCERRINYCAHVMCANGGVCRVTVTNYTCVCLSGSYSGRYCEITTRRLVVYRFVSRSLAWVAIAAMVSVAVFVMVLDVLKYCFGIDVARGELEEIRREKRAKRRKAVVQRFVYVNASPPAAARQCARSGRCLEDTAV